MSTKNNTFTTEEHPDVDFILMTGRQSWDHWQMIEMEEFNMFPTLHLKF